MHRRLNDPDLAQFRDRLLAMVRPGELVILNAADIEPDEFLDIAKAVTVLELNGLLATMPTEWVDENSIVFGLPETIGRAIQDAEDDKFRRARRNDRGATAAPAPTPWFLRAFKGPRPSRRRVSPRTRRASASAMHDWSWRPSRRRRRRAPS